ncbi:MAG: type IVB secretion system protein IcmH/DotU [Gammaproteobacteria bacterium]
MADTPDDPFASGDVTILRPRPGRRPAASPGARSTLSQESPIPSPAGQARGLPPPQADIGVPDISVSGSNALLHAAVPLLVLAGRLRGQIAHADIESLRTQAVNEVRVFEDRMRVASVPAEDVLAARYALCTVIDEAVLNTPWGAQSAWAGQSLLVTFHRESGGGDKFFRILERVIGEPSRYLALLELLHVCLALGFEGRYRLDDHGPMRLGEVRQNLYRVIQSVRGGVEADLSPHWKGVQDRRSPVVRFVPLWVVASACVLVLLGVFILFSAWLNERTSGIHAVLANVGLEPLFAAEPTPAVPQISLKSLLAEQIARGLVSVDERPGSSTSITVTVPELFASASSSVNSLYTGLIGEIGGALEKVPGHITVTGHTDDQPLRSLRFQDNFELSRARAMEVATLLKANVRDPGRIDFTGKGSSEPRYRPENLAENRARNRRVEIIHRRDG